LNKEREVGQFASTSFAYLSGQAHPVLMRFIVGASYPARCDARLILIDASRHK
jgi:hypothetical protein